MDNFYTYTGASSSELNTGIFEFDSVYSGNTTDVTETSSGSGVHNYRDLTLNLRIQDRDGQEVTDARDFLKSAFLTESNITILEPDGTVAYANYQSGYKQSSFTFTEQNNIDIFGFYAPHFGIKTEIKDRDNNTTTSEFYFYGNRPRVSSVTVTDTATGHKFTSSNGSASTQVLSGVSGQLKIDFDFLNSPEYTNFDHVDIYWASGSTYFDSNPLSADHLAATKTLSQNKNQSAFLYEENLPQFTGSDLYLTIKPYSTIGLGDQWTVGPFKFEYAEKPNTNYLTEISSGDVTGALGFTPVSSSGAGASLTLQDVTENGAQTDRNVTFKGGFTINNPDASIVFFNPQDSSENAKIVASHTSSESSLLFQADKFLFNVSGASDEVSIDGNTIGSYASAILLGTANTVYGDYDGIVAGTQNVISGDGTYASDFDFIGAGSGNQITGSSYSSIVGGVGNHIYEDSRHSFIGGGTGNTLQGSRNSVIGGGVNNFIQSSESVQVFGSYITDTSAHDGYIYLADNENRTKSPNRSDALFIDFKSGVDIKTGNLTVEESITMGGNTVLTGVTSGDITGALGYTPLSSETDDQTLDEVLAQGNTSTRDMSVGDISGTSLDITTDVTVTGDVEADEFIGDLRGAVSFRAKAGEALSAGEVVYISGVDGNTTVVAKADANDPNKMPAFGVSKETVNANANVRVVNFGSVTNLDTSNYSEGDELFVSDIAGQLTGVAPTGEASALQKMAKVTRSDNSAGSITVMGAGRSNAVPNLNEGRLFVGNSSNEAVADGTIHVDIADSRVGIGTTSPEANLHILQNSTNGQAYERLIIDGDTQSTTASGSSQAITFKGAGNGYAGAVGSYGNGTVGGIGVWGGSTNSGSPDIFVKSGNVGIGTTSPSAKLDVRYDSSKDGIFVKDEGGGAVMLFGADGSNNARARFYNGSHSQNIEINSNAGSPTYFNAGNVGIGTTSPAGELEVQGTGDLLFLRETGREAVTITGQGNGSGSQMVFKTHSGSSLAEAMRILPSGNVGIGTTNPLYKLHVAGTTYVNGGTLFIDSGQQLLWGNSNQGIKGTNDTSLEFRTGGSTKMLLDNSGNVGIGTTAPDFKLDVAGDIGIDGKLYHNGDHNTYIGFGSDDIKLRTGGTDVITVDSSQNVGIGITSPVAKLHIQSVSTSTDSNTLRITHSRSDADVPTNAAFIDMNLSGADNTTADRTNAGLKIDLDSSANGDASNEHRIYGVSSDVRFTGFSDIARGGHFYAESNYTGAKTNQLAGVYGLANHDANSTSGGVSNMYGVYGNSSIVDLGDVDNAFGGYFSVSIGTGRGAANVGVTKGVEGEIQIDKPTAIDYDTMIGVSSIIDNNEGSVPNFGNQYLFKGDYTGTKGSNAYGIFVEGDKHYFEGSVGIGTAEPSQTLHVKGIGMIEDASSTSFGTLQFGTDTLRYIRGNAAELQVGATIQQLHFQKTNGPAQVASSAADGVTAIQLLARNAHTSANLLEVVNGNGQTADFVIDSDGNVGIGETAPEVKLEVAGDIMAKDSFVSAGATASQGYTFHDFGTGWGYKGVQSPSRLAMFTSSAERVTIDSNGNVGIGTTAPTNKLEIKGAGSSTDVLNLNKGTGSGGIKFTFDGTNFVSYIRTYEATAVADNYMALGVSNGNNTTGLEVMRLKGDGKVGIGTNSPAAKLDVYSAASFRADVATGNPLISIVNNTATSNTAGTATIKFTQANTQAGGKIVSARDGNYSSGATRTSNLQFYTSTAASDTEKMRITSSGNVGIGTTSPAEKLTVIGDILIDNGGNSTLYLGKGAEGVDGVTKIKAVQTGTDTDQLGIAFNVHPNTAGSAVSEEAMRIDHDGNVGIGITSPAARLELKGSTADSTANAFVARDSASASLFSIRNDGRVDATGDVVIGGNLTVSGTTTTIDTAILRVEDHNIELGNVNTPTDITADGGGITLLAGSNEVDHKTIKWINSTDAWTFSERISITPDGSASLPALTFSGDNDTGIYRFVSGSDAYIGVSTGGAIRGQFGPAGITSSANVYSANTSAFRNYGGVWRGTTGLTGNGFQFINSVDGTALTISSTGDTVASGSVTATSIVANSSSEGTYFTGGSGSIRQLSITSGTNISAHALHTFNIASVNGKYEFDIDGTTEFSLESSSVTFAGNISLPDANPSNSVGTLKLGAGGDLSLYHNGTESNITNATGNFYISQTANDADIIFECDNGSGGLTPYFSLDGSSTGLTVSAPQGMVFFDSIKAKFGNNDDLQIYHDGSNSYIDDASGAGSLYVNTNAFRVHSADGSDEMIKAVEGASGGVFLYHDNALKLSTTSTGVSVTGHFSATTKSFLVDNPKTGGKLQYGVVESDEHGVYVRGKSDQEVVELPEEWDWLVDEDSVTVQLTSVGQMQQLFIVEQNNKRIKVSGLAPNGQYNYVVHGTRKDVDALQKHLK